MLAEIFARAPKIKAKLDENYKRRAFLWEDDVFAVKTAAVVVQINVLGISAYVVDYLYTFLAQRTSRNDLAR